MRATKIDRVHGEYGADLSAFDGGLLGGAEDVLSDLRSWKMSPARWELVADAVGSLSTAVSAGDGTRLKSAIIQLELLSPNRTHKIGDMDEPPPKPILDNVVRLIHVLGSAKNADPRTKNAKPGGKK